MHEELITMLIYTMCGGAFIIGSISMWIFLEWKKNRRWRKK